MQLGLWWCVDRHDGLVLEPGHRPQVLVRDVSVALVLIQQLQLELGIADEVVKLKEKKNEILKNTLQKYLKRVTNIESGLNKKKTATESQKKCIQLKEGKW